MFWRFAGIAILLLRIAALECNCNDLDICTQDICNTETGECTYDPIVLPSPPEENKCITGYYCDAGRQEIVPLTVYCKSANPCIISICNMTTGLCETHPKAPSPDCTFCDVSTGECYNQTINCDDSLPCTDDTFDGSMCHHTINCPQINCTTVVCSEISRLCEYKPVVCQDTYGFTLDYCDNATNKCVYEGTLQQGGVECNDNDNCTDDFVAGDNTCVFIPKTHPLDDYCTRVGCDDGEWLLSVFLCPVVPLADSYFVCYSLAEGCQKGYCLQPTDPCSYSASLNGGECTEFIRNCSGDDPYYTYSCNEGICYRQLQTCIADEDPCTLDYFDPEVQECVSVLKNCTGPDLCSIYWCDPDTGGCTSLPKNCTGPDVCSVYWCDSITGECLAQSKNCTGPDLCSIYWCDPDAGGCTSLPKNCTDEDPCTIDRCDSLTGLCTHVNLTLDDNNLCTYDYCENEIVYHEIIPCPESNVTCMIYVCQPLTGMCVLEPIPTDDGDPCTIDSCVNDTIHHVPKNCTDSDPCTQDSCNPTTGDCIHIDLCTPRRYRWLTIILVVAGTFLLSAIIVLVIFVVCGRMERRHSKRL